MPSSEAKPVHFCMPQLGESVTEGQVVRWLKQRGERVDRYEPLVEVTSDKVSAEVPSPVAGVLAEILADVGCVRPVGSPLCVIHPPGTAAPPPAPGPRYSPAVRHLAARHGIDPATVPPTGRHGRVTRRDVERALAQRVTVETSRPQEAPAPAARPLEPATEAAGAVARRPVSATSAAASTDKSSPLSPVRRLIAQRTLISKHTAPHAWTLVEVDLTGLVRARERVKAAFSEREGVPLTYLPFVIHAVARTLREIPMMNATLVDEHVILRGSVHVGVAVGLEDGVVVPVIRDADALTVRGLARALYERVDLARRGLLSHRDLADGTFTVNNSGAFGSIASFPILHGAQAAMLTLEAIVPRPVVIGEAIAIRSMANMCLSFDHRVLDGTHVGRFLQQVKGRLEALAEPLEL